MVSRMWTGRRGVGRTFLASSRISRHLASLAWLVAEVAILRDVRLSLARL